MKKTFQLNIEGKNRDRVLDSVKHEIRKYVRRERRRVLPEGTDYWDFDCRFGLCAETAEVAHLATLTKLIDGVAAESGEKFYLEILAKPAKRRARPADAAGATGPGPAASPVTVADRIAADEPAPMAEPAVAADRVA